MPIPTEGGAYILATDGSLVRDTALPAPAPPLPPTDPAEGVGGTFRVVNGSRVADDESALQSTEDAAPLAADPATEPEEESQ